MPAAACAHELAEPTVFFADSDGRETTAAEAVRVEVLAEEPEGEPFLTFFSRLGSPAAYQLAA